MNMPMRLQRDIVATRRKYASLFFKRVLLLVYYSYMALFGGAKKASEPVFSGLLGVDIGTVGVKMVELTMEGGKPRLTTYGYAEAPAGQADLSALSDPQKITDMMRRVSKEAGIRAKKAVAALPASEVFHTIVSIPLPSSPTEDLRPAIEAQAKKVFPLPVEEMVLDSVVLDKNLLKNAGKSEGKEEKERFIRIFLTGAPKTLIQKYLDLFAKVGLELVSLETEVMSLVRALVSDEDAQIMIVDIGGKRANVIIADGGIPFLTRGIKGGGEEITRALAKNMGISEADAETAKRDLGYGNGALPKPLQDALQPMVHEMRYALQMYADQAFHDHRNVEKILITGGSAHLPGIDQYVTSVLNVNVYIGNPWARIASPVEARPILEEVGPRLCVAAGLALRIIEKGML
jgi:type IV pilus assembly protein PilM